MSFKVHCFELVLFYVSTSYKVNQMKGLSTPVSIARKRIRTGQGYSDTSSRYHSNNSCFRDFLMLSFVFVLASTRESSCCESVQLFFCLPVYSLYRQCSAAKTFHSLSCKEKIFLFEPSTWWSHCIAPTFIYITKSWMFVHIEEHWRVCVYV